MANRCDEAAAALDAQMKKVSGNPVLLDSLQRQSRQNTQEANAYRAKAQDLASSPQSDSE